MSEQSKIEWTDATFNPWIGCTKVATGCEHCYAADYGHRFGVVWGPKGTRRKTSAANWRQPFAWNRKAEAEGRRWRVFCASLADVFEQWDGPIVNSKGEQLVIEEEEDTEAGDDWQMMLPGGGWMPASVTSARRVIRRPATMHDLRRDLFTLIDRTPWLDWIILTKRPENVLKMWLPNGDPPRFGPDHSTHPDHQSKWYRDNCWLLTSVSTQADADRNVPLLLKCRELVPVLGLSCEPLLGAIRFRKQDFSDSGHGPGWLIAGNAAGGPQLDWIIVGGESGPGARPMHPDWARSIRDPCVAAGVPFFFKQWGEWCDPDQMTDQCYARIDNAVNLGGSGEGPFRVGKKSAGRTLDGREWDEYPVGRGQRSEVGGRKGRLIDD